MAEKLTDRPVLGTAPADTDVVYVVDASDTTDSPQGTSKQQLFSVFKSGLTAGAGGFQELQDGALVPGGNPFCLLFKTSQNPAADDYSAIQQHDIVILCSAASLVVGHALTDFTAFPADFDDSAKFAKFIDNEPAL